MQLLDGDGIGGIVDRDDADAEQQKGQPEQQAVHRLPWGTAGAGSWSAVVGSRDELWSGLVVALMVVVFSRRRGPFPQG